ncbi:MAG TPA: ABC transporter substrate-binding protein, partial [Candidatus Lustribacter sp.]
MIARFIALVAALALVPVAGRAAPSGAPVEISAILALTGPGALIGASQRQGLEVLEKHVNDTGGIANRPLHFTFLDDQTSPQVEVQLFTGVVAKGA